MVGGGCTYCDVCVGKVGGAVVVHTDSDVCGNGGQWLYVLTVMCVWAVIVLQYELIVGGPCVYNVHTL